MNQFIIVTKYDNTNALSVLSKEEYRTNIFKYEPIASRDTQEDAKKLMLHIQNVGIQTYFQEIINQSHKK